jgi:hypothetical protein
LWLLGVIGAIVIVGAAGAISTRSMVRAKARSVLY